MYKTKIENNNLNPVFKRGGYSDCKKMDKRRNFRKAKG